jgi:5-oxoprolinase (ATP-hydrolysing)
MKGKIRKGDVFALNAPYNGGTHLPDITVVSPVFDEAGARSCSGSAPAGTTPMSAASRRAP